MNERTERSAVHLELSTEQKGVTIQSRDIRKLMNVTCFIFAINTKIMATIFLYALMDVIVFGIKRIFASSSLNECYSVARRPPHFP